jgi:hypothetical protein
LLSNVYDDSVADVLKSRGAHENNKPITDYNKHKIGGQIEQGADILFLSKKVTKMVKKFFFHYFGLFLMNAHILHQKTSRQKF